MVKCGVIFLLVVASCVAWVRADTDLVPPCNCSRSTSLSFSIVSRKNETGHWVAEVKMGPELTDGRHNGEWQIHVDQNTVDSSGKEPIVQIRATITAPGMIAPVYEFFPGIGYYKLHTEQKTWEEAKTACEQEKAHLVIINSEAESEVIQQLFARYPDLCGPGAVALVGFHDQQTEGQYVTVYGEPLASTGFTRWSTHGNQPDNYEFEENCGSVHRNGGLNDFSCTSEAPFFCEQDLLPPSNGHKELTTPRTRFTDPRIDDEGAEVKPVVNEDSPGMIAPLYEFFPGIGYYKLHTEQKTWEEAKTACEQEKAHLVIINSEAESEVIQQLFARYPDLCGPGAVALVGFHDQQTEGQYVTVYGESLVSTGFTRWSTNGNQPDNYGFVENCGSVHRNGGLNDFPCTSEAPFFCEQDLLPPSNGHNYDKGHKAVTTPRTLLIDVRIDGEEGDIKPVVNEVDIDKPKDKDPEVYIIDEIAAE